MELDKQIEAVLFYKASPIKKSILMKLFSLEEGFLNEALTVLKTRLEKGATSLIVSDDEVALVVAKEFDSLIDGLRKDELKRDIGKAGAETLAIVMYRSPITRIEIDRIRGVNSSYILRSLETRGLIEKRTGKRQSEFIPTTELFRHLGIQEKTEMPDYVSVVNALEAFEAEQNQQDD